MKIKNTKITRLLIAAILASVLGLIFHSTSTAPSKSKQPLEYAAAKPQVASPSQSPQLEQPVAFDSPHSEDAPHSSFLRFHKATPIQRFEHTTGPYRIETQIFRTSFHKPLVRLEKRYYAEGHVDAGAFIGESLSVANEFIVSTQTDSSSNEIEQLATSIGAHATPVRGSQSLFRLVFGEDENFEQLPQLASSLEVAKSMIRYVEPDFLVRTTSRKPNDPRFTDQTNLHFEYANGDSSRDIDAPEAWAITSGSPNVTIAIIDSGIRSTHEDLKDNLWVNPNEKSNGSDDDRNGIADDLYGFNAIKGNGDVSDDNGHGTHVSGIAAASGNNSKGITGVTWNAQIMALKFLDASGYGTNSNAIEAINYAIAQKADIINNSWGGSEQSQAVFETLKRASNQGILIVTAAGNNGANLDETPTYPASFNIANQVVVVASNDIDKLSSYSNYSANATHLAAPGRALSTYHPSDSSYSDLEGTSMAAPHVSGALALIKATFPGQTATKNILRLLDSTDQFPALTGKCLSSGRLNLHRALSGQTNTPANDSFENAIEFLSNGGRKAGTTSNASKQTGEPLAANPNAGKTVWYSWRSDSAGSAQLRVSPTGFAPAVTVFEGTTLQGLERVSSATSFLAGEATKLSWQYQPGETYYIQVDTNSSNTGPFTIELFKTPDNDDFENPTTIIGESFTQAGSNIAATLEADEQRTHISAAGSTVWYEWTAPRNGDDSLRIARTSERLFLRVYEGDSLTNLTEVASAFEDGSQSNQVLSVAADTTYRILVDSLSENGTEFFIEGAYLTEPKILVQPHDRNVKLGSDTTFRVVVSSAHEATYQWSKDGQQIPGATRNTLHLKSVAENDLGEYQARISLPSQTLFSRNAQLTNNKRSVQFLNQPSPASIRRGQSATLSAIVSPIDEHTQLQWLKDGKPISGQNTLTLSLANTSITDSAFYQLQVTQDGNVYHSKPAYLFVSASDEFSAFTWANIPNSSPQAHELDQVNGYFIAQYSDVGFGFSLDGENWQYIPLPIRKIVWTGERYLAVTNRSVHVSPNLSNWTRTFETDSDLYSIAFGADVAVMRASDGIYTSSDFTNWSKTSEATSGWADHLEFANGSFVVPRVGSVLVSENGTNWESFSTSTTHQCYVSYSDNKWWLYNRAAAGAAYTSPDAKTWTEFPLHQENVFSMFFDKAENLAYMYLQLTDNKDSFFAESYVEVHRVEEDETNFLKQVTRYSSEYPSPMVGLDNKVLVSTRSGHVFLSDFTSLNLEHGATPWYKYPRISYANGFYIAGSERALHTSQDGSNWTLAHSSLENYGHFAYGNGVYVGTRHSGPSLSELDRHNYNFQAILFQEGLFVGYSGGKIIYSSDGQSWETGASGMHNAWRMAYGNGTFVLYSEDGLFTSDNGIAWTQQSLPSGMRLSALRFGNNTWVAFSDNVCYTSADTKTWTRTESLSIPNHSANTINNLYFLDGRFIAPYWDEYYWSSTDGKAWTQTELRQELVNHQGYLYSPAISDSKLLLHGSSYGLAILGSGEAPKSRTIITSHNETIATSFGRPLELTFEAFASESQLERIEVWVNGQLWESLPPNSTRFQFTPETSGDYTVEVIAHSQDGHSSSDTLLIEAQPLLSITKPANEITLNDLLYFRGSYYGVGSGGLLYLSTDGISWKSLSTPVSEKLNSIAKSEDTLVVGFNGDGVLTSKDGINWIRTGSFPSGGVQYDNGLFVAGLSWKTVLSRDGLNWTPADSPSSAESAGIAPDTEDRIFNVYDQCFKGGIGRGWSRLPEFKQVYHLGDHYIGLDYNRSIKRSQDLANWETVFSNDSLESMELKNGLLFAKYYETIISVTTDGINWETPDADVYSSQIEFFDGRFYAWTYDWNFDPPNKIASSEDGVHWTKFGSENLQAEPISDGILIASPTGLALYRPEAPSYEFINEEGIAHSRTFNDFGFRENVEIIGQSPLIALTDYQSYYRDDHGAWQRTNTRVEEDTVYANGVYLGDWHFGLHRSEDGVEWTQLDTPQWLQDLNTHYSVISLQSDGNSFWLTVNYTVDGHYHYSTARSEDGLNWQLCPLEDNSRPEQFIRFKEETYFTHFSEFRKFNSDYESWNLIETFNGQAQITHTDSLIGVLHEEEIFSGYNRLSLSSDGQTWQTVSPPITGYINITATAEAFYIYGNSVWKSTNGTDWTEIIPFEAKATATRENVLFYSDELTFIEVVDTDLAIVDVSVANKEYGVGDLVEVSVSLKNNGKEGLSLPENSQIRYSYLNETGRWSRSEVEDGFSGDAQIPFQSLAPLETRSFVFTTKIPEGVAPDRYHISVYFGYDLIGDDGNKSNDYIVTSEATSITIPSRTLNVANPENGRVEGATAQSEFAWKDRVPLRAIPDFGYELENWNGDYPYAEPALLLTLQEDTLLAPVFKTQTYAVNVNIEGRGKVAGIPDSLTIQHGQDLDLEVEPEAGWVFLGWDGYGKDQSEQISMKAGRNINIDARFGRTYSSWADTHLPEDESNRGLYQTASGSSATNIERFAFGLDYLEQRKTSQLGTRIEDGYLVFRYALFAGLFEVTAEPTWSNDLSVWQDGAGPPQIVSKTDDLDIYELRVPLNNAPFFVSLKIQENAIE
ncbi:S8 family serine peptidase [Pelagicoccus mobilis]|uniref:S8 family serine peptidase n=1 Tax=Pelagicoccus mobilis TaxID=415221 RepID=A0A934RXE9_9BACT|nr:S8 family serine peptidase [Pelagicoccus mobilis]MBK1876989.1 S8 family serine peptidase [Pelagicoccus mobilis]